MKIINVSQGSDAWLQFRATRFGSSEAAAMLGLSHNCTRTELLRMKHTGIGKDFGDWLQHNVLDKGHAVEAATRPMIEAQIDDLLYAVVCEGKGRLSASLDGLTIDGVLAWECKQWNVVLANNVEAGNVPDSHMPQCQHILMVTGAERLRFTVSDGTGERLVSCEVLPSAPWFDRLRLGWAQFERDLAAYTPPATAAPAPVGKAPDTLPALRIEVTGMVTASNLAEFKQTALAAIRSVNKDLRTDADFADADKAVKWCGDVEARLKAAKEHALSQTADIDALFKALDDIGAEARTVRLDLDKLVTRRKGEVKESAVLAARKALDQHIAALNGELAPMRLLPVAADFPGAIKGLRSISSMQDALDTMLANAKIAADAQGRMLRVNLAHFAQHCAGFEFLFADLGELVHKDQHSFVDALGHRVGKHQADQARRESERQAAEQRARDQEAARIAGQQAESERLAARAVANAAELVRQRPLMQDECRPLSAALASKPDAPMHAREAAAAINEPALLNLGTISVRLGFTVRADFLAELGVQHVATDKAARLYRESQWPLICRALCQHIADACELAAA